jgi:hypothetical protein
MCFIWTKILKSNQIYLNKENECLSGRYTCHEPNEECVDLEDGFMCKCVDGYIMEANHCRPVCNQSCVFGTCIEPDVCECDFGEYLLTLIIINVELINCLTHRLYRKRLFANVRLQRSQRLFGC